MRYVLHVHYIRKIDAVKYKKEVQAQQQKEQKHPDTRLNVSVALMKEPPEILTVWRAL